MCWLRNEMGFALFGFYVFEFRQKLRESIWGKNRINKISFCEPIAFGSLAAFPFLFLLFSDGCYTENGPSIFAESVLYFLPANEIQKTRRKVPMLKVKLLTTKSRLNFCFIRDCFAKCWKLVLLLKQQRIQMPCCIYKAKIAGNIWYKPVMSRHTFVDALMTHHPESTESSVNTQSVCVAMREAFAGQQITPSILDDVSVVFHFRLQIQSQPNRTAYKILSPCHALNQSHSYKAHISSWHFFFRLPCLFICLMRQGSKKSNAKQNTRSMIESNAR